MGLTVYYCLRFALVHCRILTFTFIFISFSPSFHFDDNCLSTECRINITLSNQAANFRVFCPCLMWAQSMSHFAAKGEVTPVTHIWCQMWGSWYVDIQWLGYHPNPALPSAGIGQPPSAWLPKWNKNHVLSLRNSVQMFISQVPDCLTSGNRVEWLWAHSGWTLSMFATCTNCVCISQRRRLCPINHLGTSKSVVINPQCSQREWWQEADWEGPSSEKETHPRRTAMPKHERGSPRHNWRSKQIYSFVN